MQKYLPKHLSKKSITLQSFLPKKRKKDWRGKPVSWPDIRKNAEDGHIYLLCDTRYPIGFTATATGGYSVKIDDVAYDNYTSNEKFSMADWTDYTTTEGYTIDYPTGATKAHIIDIYPQNTANNITAFHCARVAASGNEEQGVLWAHFNISNAINISNLLWDYNTYFNRICMACTAKNNLIDLAVSFAGTFYKASSLEYIPTFTSEVNGIQCQNSFKETGIKKAVFKNFKPSVIYSMFESCYNFEEVKGIDYSAVTYAHVYMRDTSKLKDTVIDVSSSSTKSLGIYGNSQRLIRGLKNLRVSNQAPFDYQVTPQINVSYTGMSRDALVLLFNDLPTVSSGQIINIVGCTGASDLTGEDEAIATAKGWTITK